MTRRLRAWRAISVAPKPADLKVHLGLPRPQMPLSIAAKWGQYGSKRSWRKGNGYFWNGARSFSRDCKWRVSSTRSAKFWCIWCTAIGSSRDRHRILSLRSHGCCGREPRPALLHKRLEICLVQHDPMRASQLLRPGLSAAKNRGRSSSGILTRLTVHPVLDPKHDRARVGADVPRACLSGSPGNARQQAARGTFDPGYLNYPLGKLMIRKLREEWMASRGGRQSWRVFHDQFLSYGGPPIPLIRKAMLGSNAARPYRGHRNRKCIDCH
jgi:Bacterial protein of unknown function (DUF885)